ncbi:MAG TPA: LysR substrate-binding domain-containing protein [Thermoanaerobaculia bacterium]|jgi:LysR family transcriptional regulator for metE and metH|nr:LysR substrate-binding domain-containing protein [Thermoanaerobaculia bacterium]
MTLEIRHLLLVAAVSEEGTLTKASTRLHLTQSALSHQLLDLEERLGTKLFHRVSKRMILTAAGDRILASAKRVLEDLRHAEEEVRLLVEEKRGLLRITTECYTCYHWLPALLARFRKKHPGVDVRIDVASTKRPAEALAEGSIDLALVSSEMDDRRLRITPLFDDELLVIMAPDHPLADREAITAKELAAETLLTYGPLDDSTAYLRVLRPAGFEPKEWMPVPLTEAMVELARGGIGVAVLARWSVWPQLESGAIVGVPLTRRGLHRQWKAAVLRAAQTPDYMEEFIGMLAAQPARQRNIPLHVPKRA